MSKRVKWFSKRSVLIAVLAVVGLGLGSWCWAATPDTAYRIMRYNISGIDDNKIFAGRPLRASSNPFHFKEADGDEVIPQTISVSGQPELSLDEVLEGGDSVAFLVIRDDTILFERYYQGYDQSTPSLSFSMAKSFLSILIGCAIDDGYIRSVDQPVTDFVPELAENGFGRVTLEHLLQMTSGMDYVESDNPFGIHPRFYYTRQLEREILRLGMRAESGQGFAYKSGENALLGLILTRAIGDQTITDYLQERLWEPLGMEYGGGWSIDHEGDGLEKTWCCVSATARDYAKLGRLYLNQGNWDGEQVVSQEWVERSTRVDTSNGSAWDYQYQWWLVDENSREFMASGHLGQYLYVNPDTGTIIVRLGKSGGDLEWQEWMEVMTTIGRGSY